MKDRFLRLCVRAYPRERQRADGEAILDLARELAADNGALREGFALAKAGLRERIERHAFLRLLARLWSGPLPIVLGLLFGVGLVFGGSLTDSWVLGVLFWLVPLVWIVTAIADRWRRRRAQGGPFTPAE
jgi:hypothetical protein